VSSPKADHFGGSTAVPFFMTSPMYIAISALVLNLVVTLVWAFVSSRIRTAGPATAARNPATSAPETSSSTAESAVRTTQKGSPVS
jgi:solute:Na+ symporter, SSS family